VLSSRLDLFGPVCKKQPFKTCLGLYLAVPAMLLFFSFFLPSFFLPKPNWLLIAFYPFAKPVFADRQLVDKTTPARTYLGLNMFYTLSFFFHQSLFFLPTFCAEPFDPEHQLLFANKIIRYFPVALQGTK
jgi:hypothetical protein